jgi:hypothetical protein
VATLNPAPISEKRSESLTPLFTDGTGEARKREIVGTGLEGWIRYYCDRSTRTGGREVAREGISVGQRTVQ